MQDNTIVNDLLHQLNANNSTSDEINESSSIHISHDQLSALLRMLQQQQAPITALTNQASPHHFCTPLTDTTNLSSQQSTTFPRFTRTPEYYNNAKYEDLISKPI